MSEPETPDLDTLIEKAFDYRGDVTIELADGSQTEGFVFSRNKQASPPFLMMFLPSDPKPKKIFYSMIRNIRFTGKDASAGKTWEEWKARQKKQNAGKQ